MKERPILFSRPMVRALLAGEKTQARRLLRRQPEAPRCIYDCDGADTVVTAHCAPGHATAVVGFSWEMTRLSQTPAPFVDGATYDQSCPYGNVGDALWVRETWSPDHRNVYPCPSIVYRADNAVEEPIECPSWCKAWQTGEHNAECLKGAGFKWRPSIFMRRGASRLSLRITGIRVERVQSISEADAIAEGMAHYWREMDDKAARKVEHRWDAAARAHGYEKTPPDYRGLYAVLWDAINGKRAPFASNPWTWVIDVERVPRG